MMTTSSTCMGTNPALDSEAVSSQSPSTSIDALSMATRRPPSESDYHRTVAASLSNSGAYHHMMNSHARAIKLYQEACGVREEALKLDEARQSHLYEVGESSQQQQQQLQHYAYPPCGGGLAKSIVEVDDKKKDDERLRLEAWVRRATAEEHRLGSLLAAERRGGKRSAPPSPSPSPALDLFQTDVDDRPDTTFEHGPDDLFDWSLGSDPICIVHPHPEASPTTASKLASQEQQDYVESCKTLFNMGLVHLQRRADDQAHDIFRMALSVLPPQAAPTLHAHLLNHLALTQARTGREDVAIRTLNGALQFEQEHFNSVGCGQRQQPPSVSSPSRPGAPHQQQALDVATCVSDTLSLLARAHRARGELGRAGEIAAECLRVRTARLGGSGGGGGPPGRPVVHPDVACGQYNLGLVLVESGRAEEGMPHLDSFVDWVMATFKNQSSQAHTGIHHQGQQQQGQDQQQQTLSFFPIDPKTADKLSWALYKVALYHLELCSSVTRALTTLNLSLLLRRTYLVRADPTIALILNALGQVYSDIGSVRDALVCFRESIYIFRSTMGTDHPDVAAVLCDLGRLHHERGELDEALASYCEALRIARIELASVEGWRGGHQDHQGQSSRQQQDRVYEEEEDDGTTEQSVAELLRIVGNVHLERGDSSGAMSSFAEAERMVLRSASALAASQARQVGNNNLELDQPPAPILHLQQSGWSSSDAVSTPIVVPITDPNGRGMNFHPCAAAA